MGVKRKLVRDLIHIPPGFSKSDGRSPHHQDHLTKARSEEESSTGMFFDSTTSKH